MQCPRKHTLSIVFIHIKTNMPHENIGNSFNINRFIDLFLTWHKLKLRLNQIINLLVDYAVGIEPVVLLKLFHAVL